MAKEKATNGLKPEQEKIATEVLARCENIDRETESEKGKYRAFCKQQAAAKKEILSEAKAEGLSVKALKGVLKQREHSRKIDKIADGFDIDDQSQYELLEEKLGGFADLPLGKAAIAAAKGGKTGDAKNTATVN